MRADNFVLADYLQRILFTGEARADFATLQALMRQQLYTVPFENLDVQAGKVVSLRPEDIVAKIVYGQRGGYCYEVNGLFAMALRSLGIACQFVAARPMFYPVMRPKTHMALVASIAGERWLCDLGFGSYGIREPLALSALNVETRQDFDTFKLSKLNAHEFLLQARVDGEWGNQYSFDLYEPDWIDFAPANFMNSTHPDTIFVQKTLIVLHNASGRKILLGDTLKTIDKGATTKLTVDRDNYAALLQAHFGLQAPMHSKECGPAVSERFSSHAVAGAVSR